MPKLDVQAAAGSGADAWPGTWCIRRLHASRRLVQAQQARKWRRIDTGMHCAQAPYVRSATAPMRCLHTLGSCQSQLRSALHPLAATMAQTRGLQPPQQQLTLQGRFLMTMKAASNSANAMSVPCCICRRQICQQLIVTCAAPTILPDGAGLLWVRQRRAGVRGLEVHIVFVRHCALQEGSATCMSATAAEVAGPGGSPLQL